MATPEVGTVLRSRYVLQEQLGKNATRQTWLASDREEDRNVVIKMLAFNLQLQWQEVKLFEREAQALQQLDHPRIPHYLDYFTVEGQPSWMTLVQSYVPGESLQALLDVGEQFDEERLGQIATDVLTVLTYLHDRKPPVLHRDIKPSNLIVGEDGQTYVVDFGAAQMQPAQIGTFTVVGTYGYTPMEQFGGRAVPSSDLYALGATLIHLATGVSPADLPLSGSKMDFRDRADLSAHFSSWLETLIEPLVGDRFASAEEAIANLQNLNAGSEESKPIPLFSQKSKVISQDNLNSESLPHDVSLSSDIDELWISQGNPVPNSSLRYQVCESGMEIRFKTHQFDSYMRKGEVNNNHWQRSRSLGSVSILCSVLFFTLGTLLMPSGSLTLLILALSSGFISLLSRMFSYSFEYIPNAPEISLLVKDGYLTLWKVQYMTGELLFFQPISQIQKIKFYGKGNAMAENRLHFVSARIDSMHKGCHHVDSGATLRKSELKWVQDTIDRELKRISSASQENTIDIG